MVRDASAQLQADKSYSPRFGSSTGKAIQKIEGMSFTKKMSACFWLPFAENALDEQTIARFRALFVASSLVLSDSKRR